MPSPRTIRVVPVIPFLPAAFRHMAEFTITCPRSSPDHLFLLAEACDEMPARMGLDSRTARALRTLATELRRRAPEYA